MPMDILKKVLLIYIIAINIISLILCGIDKRRAIVDKWRIPESVLLGISALGGSVGLLIGMYLFNHKIKKPKFYLSVPIMAALQAVLAAYLYYKDII